jgi:hypothetical protein
VEQECGMTSVGKQQTNKKTLFTGLKYFEDFEERIPRVEMELMERYVINLVHSIDPDILINPCGS